PRAPSGARAQLVHGVDDGRDVRERRIGKYAVTEVEHVTGPTGGTFQDARDPTADLLHGREQGDGIAVALEPDGRAEPLPRLGEIDSPVEPDDVATRVPHELEQGGGAGTEVNDRNPGGGNRVEGPPHVRQHVNAIVVGREAADPAIEELDRL